MSGALPNASPRRQVFCVLVEYRLYSTGPFCTFTSTLDGMYQPAIGVRRPVVDLTVLFDLLDKEQFAQTVHVVCGLHVEHLGYYGVQPPGGVPLYDGHLLLEAVQHLQVCK